MRRPIRSLVSLVGLLGCTPQLAEPRPEQPRSTSGATPALVDSPSPATEPTPIPEGPAIPGFVIYTPEQTVVVTADGAPTIAEGLWVQDDRGSSPAITHTLLISDARADYLGMPACACLASDGACTRDEIETRRFGPDATLIDAPDPACTCVRRPEPFGFPASEIDGEQFEACAGGDDEIVASLVGGRLYALGWDWNGACGGGLSLYDAMESEHLLIADPPPIGDNDMRLLGCDNELGPVFTARPWPIDLAALTTECEDHDESEAFMLRRGDLWSVRDNISGVFGFRRWFHRPARPESCPSVNDPCGDPAPFEDRAGLDRRKREFWIATDGTLALTAERHAYAIWAIDVETPIEFELLAIDASDDVLGVRTHADLRPLLAVIAKHPKLGRDRGPRAPTVIEPDVCLAAHGSSPGTAKELGNLCFELIGIEQWTAAEAACLQGLAVAIEPASRGAILYNLGQIAAAQGAVEQAATHYRSSLVSRPGNATVERALAKLGTPTD